MKHFRPKKPKKAHPSYKGLRVRVTGASFDKATVMSNGHPNHVVVRYSESHKHEPSQKMLQEMSKIKQRLRVLEKGPRNGAALQEMRQLSEAIDRIPLKPQIVHLTRTAKISTDQLKAPSKKSKSIFTRVPDAERRKSSRKQKMKNWTDRLWDGVSPKRISREIVESGYNFPVGKLGQHYYGFPPRRIREHKERRLKEIKRQSRR